jgi:hypothetical protein
MVYGKLRRRGFYIRDMGRGWAPPPETEENRIANNISLTSALFKG